MNIGLYFGTFNPIHVGHLIIANYMVEHTDVDQVWMVVTPQNPLKDKSTLLKDSHRLNIVREAIEDNVKLRASDIEFHLSKPNYTISTLTHLNEKYPEHQFSLIMGEDNLNSLHKWKNYEYILENHEIYVYPRLDGNNQNKDAISSETRNSVFKNHPKIHFIAAPIVEISATFIRESIKINKNVQPLLPSKVWEYIDYNNLYKK